jgi:L-ascorbate metabolism protein UlaG (beta-lactamase superfamily)
MPCTITLINHATVLIQVDGVNILTDPVYSNTISFFIPRLGKPGIPFDDLPPIHLILISHSDYDHLNLRTLRRLRKKHDASIVVPNGLANYARRTGFEKVIEMNWWDEKIHDDVLITAVPAQHSGTRMLVDRGKSLACGYVLQSESGSVYFAGDTGYGDFLKEIGAKFSLDVALLPIGAYKPHDWFKNIHLNPHSAVQAFLDLRATNLVPIHWGTFKISDEPMSEPPILLMKEAARCGVQDRVHILHNGECFSIR